MSFVALSGLTIAQGQASQPSVRGNQKTVRVTKVGAATINLATGVITRGENNDKCNGFPTVFTNTDTSGFFGTGAVVNSATGNLIEWLDWGLVDVGAPTDITSSFTFGYGTSATDTTLGGPGASAILRFYNGATGFCADSGLAPAASYSFTGLPGASPGTAAGWIISVDLIGGFEFLGCPGGAPFGFGFTTTDDFNGDLSRDTGPLLSYAGDPFGPNMNPSTDPDANGQVDVFDEWDDTPQSNLCLGSFFFGGPPNNFSSWYLTMQRPDGTHLAGASFRNGTGTNPANFAVASLPTLGGTFVATDTSSNGGLGVFIVGYATPLSFPTGFGELLVNVADPGGDLLAGFNGPYLFSGGVATIALPVGIDLSICGLGISCQTFEFGGGVQLHNAQDISVGF